MRRKSDKDIKKEYRIFLILGIIYIVTGMFFISVLFLPSTPYEEYVEKEVIISKFDNFHGVRYAASYDYIVTVDGDEYNITGEYDHSELSELLTEGTPAIIKYDVNDILPFKQYVEEMIVDGEKIVTYNNDEPANLVFPVIFLLIFCLMGFVFLFTYRSFIIRNRKLQEKRNARIIKKYGMLKNNPE